MEVFHSDSLGVMLTMGKRAIFKSSTMKLFKREVLKVNFLQLMRLGQGEEEITSFQVKELFCLIWVLIILILIPSFANMCTIFSLHILSSV